MSNEQSPTYALDQRWSLGGYARQYAWPQCRYCGRAQDHDCARVECLLCGTPQCHGNGRCAICHHGWLPGWSRTGVSRTCDYKGCEGEAVATARKRSICADHAARVVVQRGVTLSEYVKARVTALRAGTLKVGSTPWMLVP